MRWPQYQCNLRPCFCKTLCNGNSHFARRTVTYETNRVYGLVGGPGCDQYFLSWKLHECANIPIISRGRSCAGCPCLKEAEQQPIRKGQGFNYSEPGQ